MHHRRLLVLVVFVIIFSFDVARETDMDFWWHVRTGEIIAETWEVPKADVFSYTAEGRPWVVHEWLWELIVFYLCDIGGYRLAVLISAALVTLAYGILYRLLRRLGANEILAAALVLWAAGLALPNLGVRPREITHLLLAVYLHQLFLYREGSVRSLWLLPALMVLWVNMHGIFALGIGVLGIVGLGELYRWLRDDAPFPRHMLIVGVLTVAATAVNPYGLKMLLYPLNYYFGADNPSFRVVDEFASPNFHDPIMMLFIPGLIAFMFIGIPRRRSPVADGLLLAVFTLSALVSARQVSVCAMVLAPLLVLRLVEEFSWARERPLPQLPKRLELVNWGVLVVLLLAGAGQVARPEVYEVIQLGWEPNVGKMPEAAARYIEENDLPGPVFHHQAWGGYLIYRWYPQRKVFMDGRVDMYGPEIAGDYIEAMAVRPGWRDVFDRYDIRTVMLPKGAALSVILHAREEWQHLLVGDAAEIFFRASSGGTAAQSK
jgi:hypothetical protein